LLGEYLKNMPSDVSQPAARVPDAGRNRQYLIVRLVGDTERKPAALTTALQGPTFSYRIHNTQKNIANHVHSYWRDMAGPTSGCKLKK